MQNVTREDSSPRDALQSRVRTTVSRLSETGALPTLSSVATAALAIARDADADIDRLCRVVQTDVGLAARILRVANSAAFGRRNPARMLQEAVMSLGLRKTCDIIVAAGAKRLYELPHATAETLWTHALAVALGAEQVARVTRRVQPADAFLPGLFHDLGRIVFLLADPVSADVIDGFVDSGEGEAIQLEVEWYGFDHGTAGATLAEEWGLALEQCDAIRWHHQPSYAGAAADLAAVLNAADHVAYTIECGSRGQKPESISAASLELSEADEALCIERTREALAVQLDLFT